MGKGVRCEQCGGSTPLPDDLRVPTFECRYCSSQLETARYAKLNADVDHFIAFMDRARSGQRAQQAVQVLDFSGSVQRSCLHCGQPVDVSVSSEDEQPVDCASCGQRTVNSQYLSEEQRWAASCRLDLEDRDRIQELHATGVTCQGCGGHNPMPPLDTGQAPCVHCNRSLLLVDHLPERLVARERFLHDAMKASRGQSACLSCLLASGAVIFIAAMVMVVGYAVYTGIAAGFGG